MDIKCIHRFEDYSQIHICDGCGNLNLNCPHCDNLILITPRAVVDYLNKLYDLGDQKKCKHFFEKEVKK